MRKMLALVLLLGMVGPAWALSRRWSQSQTLTQAAPSATCTGASTSATCGLDLATLKGYRVCVQVAIPASQTLSGAGSLQAYYYDYDLAAWARSDTSLDFTVSASGVAQACSPDYAVLAQKGRVYYAATGVTVSAGTTVTVSVVGTFP